MNKLRHILYLNIFLLVYMLGGQTAEAIGEPARFPRKANYFLKWQLTPNEAKDLSKWDVVVLDMETEVNSRELLQKMRAWNPRIILLAYISPPEIQQDAPHSASSLRRSLSKRIPDNWYLASSQGRRLSFWPGTYDLNIADNAPVVQGKRYNQAFSEFVVQEVLNTGLWDGVFYDNAWDDPRAFVGDDIDLDSDGVADTDVVGHWQAGMKFIYSETRRLTGNRFIIVGNGTTRAYRSELNGNMLENFLPAAWGPTMRTYAYNQNRAYNPVVNIVNANTSNRGGQNNYRAMRFGLTSALLEDGYYSFDYGDRDHGQIWHYDEYATDLGRALGRAVAKSQATVYQPDVWQREFELGLSVVNSTDQTQEVDLAGEYEKIHGVDDPTANDGAIVDSLLLDAYDGRILLKPLSFIYDTLFLNGAFVRFFHPDGHRARNGFFAFDSGIPGGNEIARVDIEGSGQRDLLAISKNVITARREDGQPLMKLYPYTANYHGTLRVALGKNRGASAGTLVVAPGAGGKQPIRVYTLYGDKVGADLAPLGIKYTGGYTAAIGSFDQGKTRVIVVGAGRGQEPYVYLYNEKHELIRKWLAFEKNFRGGIIVTMGDVNGDGKDEVIVGAGPGKKSIIKIFNDQGREVYPQFTAFATDSTPGIAELRTADVDHDGKDEIVVISGSAGF